MSMEAARCARTFRVVLRFFLCVECLHPLGYNIAKCKVRRAEFKISRKAIAEQERAEADGHQPWRSDARSVANVGLMQVEPTLTISDIDKLQVKQIFESEKRSVFVYESRSAKKSYRVTVRRFNWQDSGTNADNLSGWWLTEISIRDCSKSASTQ